MHEKQFSKKGFEWVDLNHRQESVVAYRRMGKKRADDLLIILNLTPVVRMDWTIQVKGKVYKQEIFNSDEKKYWGSANVFNPEIRSKLIDKTQKVYELKVNLPPLGGIVLK